MLVDEHLNEGLFVVNGNHVLERKNRAVSGQGNGRITACPTEYRPRDASGHRQA